MQNPSHFTGERSMENLQYLLAVARGEEPAELLFRGGRIVNVLSGEIHEGDVAVAGGRIVGIGDYEEGKTIVEAEGLFLAPSFIDGHIHLESTMLTIPEFARAVVPRGTGGVVVDPHEFANVAGTAGIEYVIESARGVPLDVSVMVPSCVPATPLETSGAEIGPDDIASFLGRRGVIGLAEMMNYPGVYLGWESELAKIACAAGYPVDGHAPGLGGRNLNAYILAGAGSDHECTAAEEAQEKLRRGMHILIREGSTERNLRDLLPLVTPMNATNFSFASDDRHPADLAEEGHIDHAVRTAIACGLDAVLAFQLATINTARHYRLAGIGAIAPGYYANIAVFEDLRAARPIEVYYRGTLVARQGAFLGETGKGTPALPSPMHVKPLPDDAFAVPVRGELRGIRVVGVIPGQILTRALVEKPAIRDGLVVSDPERDILKLAVVERHRGTGNIGVGFVRGFGLRRGAIASTVCHDAHNIIAVGVDDRDIAKAVRVLAELGGGQCVIDEGTVAARLALPVGGLVSDRPLEDVRSAVHALSAAARRLGCVLRDPFMTLSFLALSPVPALRVTDRGVVDAERFEIVDVLI
ncbi:MAG: adenine deaminase [Bacteroidota bacterium]|nr:adenine deaminase [Bacteroidota bacterium]